MKYRIAKPQDLNRLVNLHFSVRNSYNVGIFAQLDKSFLRQYYKIILNDKNEIIVCAEDEFGEIQGFCSATMDVELQFENIRYHKFQLGLSAVKSILLNPKLFKSLIDRYKSTKNDSESIFISTKGARLEYWVWSTKNKDSFSSIEMHEVLLTILRVLGIKILNFEVDTINKKIYQFHKYNGAELTNLIKLKDGRERAMMKYNLNER